ASPGPACYGRGGVEATVTDAHMIRGTIRAEAFLGGAMQVDRGAAARAFEPLASHFDMALEQIADSAVRVANANIVRAIELVSTERGRDPRDYVLVPYGGAGPLHAVRVAEALGIGTVVVPPNAGVLSAFGLLAADFAQYDTMTRRVEVNATAPERVREIYREMAARARDGFAAAGIDSQPNFTFTLDMRYVGQAFEVQVPLDPDALEHLSADDLAARFAEVHIQGYGFGGTDYGACEIMSFRVGALAPPSELPALREAESSGTGTACKIFDQDEWHDGGLARRARIDVDGSLSGPALVEGANSTIFIPRGWRATMDSHYNLVIESADEP
ncbi:MAG: hydantoinase/oxoprolinase family protein, partial [Alphaproteobacteria bacterium]